MLPARCEPCIAFALAGRAVGIARICRTLGVSRSMAGWKGHPPGKGGVTPGPDIR